jgi:hypothetical protein
VQGFQVHHPGHRAPDQILGLFQGLFRFLHVHPGVLVADVGHIKEIGVEAHLLDGLLEHGHVGPGAAGGHHHPVELVFGDGRQDLVLGVGGTGEQVLVGQDHPRQGGDIFGEGRDVDDPADVDAAVADKDAHPGFLALHVDLRGQFPFFDGRAPGRAQEFTGGGRGGGGLHDRLGNVFGALEDAADIDAVFIGVDRGEGRGVGEAGLGFDLDSHGFGQAQGIRGGFQAHRQDHHVKDFGLQFALLREVADGNVIGARHRVDGVDPGAQEADPVFVLGPPVVLFEVLAVGAHVHEEDGGIQGVVFAMLLGDDRLLDGVHAADRGAVAVVAVVQVPGAHALEPGDLQGLLVVRGPHQVAGKGPGGAQDALELQAGHHVGIRGIVVGIVLLGIKDRKARRQDDRAHLQLQLFRSQLVGHRQGLAGLGALHTLGANPAVDAAGRFFDGRFFFIAQVDFLKALDPLFHRQGGHEGPVLFLDIGGDGVPMAFFLGDGADREVPAGLQVLA